MKWKQSNLQNENNEQNLDIEDVAFIEQENIFMIDEISLQKYFEIINILNLQHYIKNF